MKTQFDKIYVVSLITNKDRQEFITYQMNELGLEFEFIYGTDFYNFENIIWPNVYENTIECFMHDYSPRAFGCAMTHYQAVNQAYHLGYNNVLVLEDDICLNKDKTLWEMMLNNIPNNIDFIDYDPRFNAEDLENKFINYIKQSNDDYIVTNNTDECKYFGSAIYAIMNRNMMKLYLTSQHKKFVQSDWVDHFYKDVDINRYVPKYCMFVDQLTYDKVFIRDDRSFYICWNNPYLNLYKDITKDNFFTPTKFNIHSIDYNGNTI